VAALENKLETSEKQVAQLQKALGKTDTYIEDLEKELNLYRKDFKTKSNKGKDGFDLDSTLNPDDSVELPSQISSISDDNLDYRLRDTGKKKRLERSFEDDKSSFDLELPSPMTSASRDHFNESDATDDSFLALREKPESVKKKLRFNLPSSFEAPPPVKPILKVDDKSSEPADLNISMTPEMEDCMRLMAEAERKLEQRHQPLNPATSFPLTFQPVLSSSSWSNAVASSSAASLTFSSIAPSFSSSSSIVRNHAVTTALLMDANSASLSQPSTAPLSTAIPGFSYHLSQ
jgi:hypothetical protein